MRRSLSFFFALFALVILNGCQTSAIRYDQAKEGRWQAKALVRDKKEGRSAVVALDVNARQSQQLRMDVTAAMGHPVASLVLAGDQLSYVLIESKQYYKGAATASALKPILSVPMDPKLLYNIFFDLPVAEKSWTCSKDNKGYLVECKDGASETTIRWGERQVKRKLVTLDHASGTVQVNVSDFQPKVEDRADLFELTTPKTFRAIR